MLTKMVELRKTFFKSKESEEAFAKVGLTYENSIWDNDYEAFVRTTKKTSDTCQDIIVVLG